MLHRASDLDSGGRDALGELRDAVAIAGLAELTLETDDPEDLAPVPTHPPGYTKDKENRYLVLRLVLDADGAELTARARADPVRSSRSHR